MSVDLTQAEGVAPRTTLGAGTAVTKGKPSYSRSRKKTVAVVSGLVLTATCLLMVAPFLWAAVSSVKPTDVAFSNPPVFSFAPTFQPYVDLWQTTSFYIYLTNTVVVAIISTLVALAVGLPCAYALS
ncbi:MAG: carbohydrate ABC transporter permease, partial [Propionibacteriaceae bacterium]